MIGMIGLLGIASIVAACVTVVCTAVSVGVGVDQANKQEEALDKQEEIQNKSYLVEKFRLKKKQMASRRAAASGTLASIIETKKMKYKTDATYRKMTQIQSSKSVIGHARVNRGTYNYGSPVQS